MKNISIYKNHQAFTLIELLVVMMIIALLAGISAFGLQGARESGRDSRRKADLENIRSALELYKSDCGEYPAAGSFPAVGNSLTGDGSNCPASNVYLSEMPGDPSSGSGYAYTLPGSGDVYYLCSHLEEPPASPNITNCGTCDPSPCAYRTTSP